MRDTFSVRADDGNEWNMQYGNIGARGANIRVISSDDAIHFCLLRKIGKAFVFFFKCFLVSTLASLDLDIRQH